MIAEGRHVCGNACISNASANQPTNQPGEARHSCCFVHLAWQAAQASICEKCREGSDLFQWLLDKSAVSPLGQDDGLHMLPVQAAALGSVQGQLGRGVVVLRGEAELHLIYIHKDVLPQCTAGIDPEETVI